MKSKLLIAHKWKLLGWILLIPAVIAGIYYMSKDDPEGLTVTLPEWLTHFMWIESLFSNTKVTQISLLDEVITLSILIGLLLLAFSREKMEDEWIQQVRLESFQWAMLVNTLLLMAFTIFTHGMPFFSIMVYNMFTPLFLFVGRFYFVLYLKPTLQKAES
ncbi:MAG: hypothetical protein R3A50_10925 [Saprospiraceae bacterium]